MKRVVGALVLLSAATRLGCATPLIVAEARDAETSPASFGEAGFADANDEPPLVNDPNDPVGDP